MKRGNLRRLVFGLICLLFSFSAVGTSVYAQSLSQDDQNSIYQDSVWYKPSLGFSTGLCQMSGVSSGTISPNAGKGMTASAQQKFQQILVAAGNKFNVSPNFIAAFYYAENSRTGDSTNNGDSAQPPPVTGDGNWREPAAPYGTGAPWPSNSFTASGPFQFIDSTWAQYGVDGNGDGVVSVNDLTDAAFAAAKYLAAAGGTTNANQSELKKAAFAYNHSDIYAQSVLNTYDYLEGGGQSSVSGSAGCQSGAVVGGLTNPFPGGWIPNRLDMGYDGTFKGQIVAPFSGIIIYAGLFNGWNGSYGVTMRSSSSLGSAVPTDTLYFTEGVYPLVKSGQVVSAGAPIARAFPSPYGNAYLTTPDGLGQIEWGVAQDGPIGTQTDTYALKLGAGKCPNATPQSRSMVLTFASWAEQSFGLGTPSTTSDAGCA